MAYQRPMVTVDQNMTIAPTSIERDQPAFIFGPNFELHRYSDPSEKPKTAIGTFDPSYTRQNPMKAEYPGAIDDEMVDKDYTRLFGDNVVAELANLTPDSETAYLPETHVDSGKVARNGGYTKIFFAGKVFVSKDYEGKDAPLSNIVKRSLAAGDRLLISYGIKGSSETGELMAEVTGVEYRDEGWNMDDSDSSSEITEGGTLVTIEDAVPEIANPNTVKVKLVTVLDGVEFESENLADSGSVGEYQWKQEEITLSGKTVNGIVVNELNVNVIEYSNDPSDYFKVLYADLFVTFRELLTAYADTFHSVTGASEVYNLLGTVDPDNPLAMGVYMAALNSATDDGDEAPPVYFMAVPEYGSKGYESVLSKATLTDKAYVFAPTTRDETVLEMVRNHVLEMSTKTVKMWRIAAASAEIPATVNRLDSKLNPWGNDYLAIPVSDKGTGLDDGPFNMIRVVKASDDPTGNTDVRFRSTLVVGDRVKFGYYTDKWGNKKHATYVIKKIINNYTVEVNTDDGPIDVEHLKYPSEATYFTPSKIEIYHAYTSAESADVIKSVSASMASRRMLNVFPSQFENDGVKMTGEFAACAVAGLISATEPQQPITNVTVRGIDNIPMAYQEYNNAELDVIASGGTFIIMQDLPHDNVYVRHQITTAYPDGNLNTAELSITKNVDSISYAFDNVFKPYYGNHNVTTDILVTFRNLASQLIDQFAGSTSIYGPQLIAEQTSINYVRQNELMKDRVDVGITLGVPYPCNNIDIVLTV